MFSAHNHSGKFVGKVATWFWFACKYLNYHNKQYNQKHNELIKPLETNTENHTNSSNDGVSSSTVNCMQPLWNIIDRICCTQKRKQPEQLLSTGSCTFAVHWASQLNLGGVLDAQQLLMATRDIHSDCKVSMTIKWLLNIKRLCWWKKSCTRWYGMTPKLATRFEMSSDNSDGFCVISVLHEERSVKTNLPLFKDSILSHKPTR